MILYNGKVFAGEAFNEAVVIRDRYIEYVGNDEDAMKMAEENEKTIDLAGRLVLPGFIESHAHGALMGVSSDSSMDISEGKTAEECCNLIRSFVEEHPDVDFYKGSGWASPLFAGAPSKEILDEICRDKPMVLKSMEGHAIWVNSKAIEMAGIDENTPQPRGGAIFKNPDGTLKGSFADEAQELINAIVPDESVETYKRSILAFQGYMISYGYTSAAEMMVTKGSNLDKAFHELAEEGSLKIKFQPAYVVTPQRAKEDIEALKSIRPQIKNKLIEDYYAKIFIDGVVENGTAALKEPYSNDPGFSGELLWEDEKLIRTCIALDNMGYNIHFHVIGDRAVQQAADVIEAMIKVNGEKSRRPVAAHVQLADGTDLKHFADLGISVSANPYWFFRDEVYTVENEIPLLGERANRQYPMKSMTDLGIVVSTGSDFPITEIPNPLYAIKCGVERVNVMADADDKASLLNPSERVDLKTMIDSVTVNGAYTMNIEKITGSLEAGKLADIAVLDKDIFTEPAGALRDARVDYTISEGEIVYSR